MRVLASELGDRCHFAKEVCQKVSHAIRQSVYLILLLAAGVVLVASCGNGEDEPESTPTIAPSLTPPASATPHPTASDQPASVARFLPCHVDLAAAQDAAASVSQTPEVVRIEMLEHPYRIVPNDIVLEQNTTYRLIVEAGSKWHSLRIYDFFDKNVDLILPPHGRADLLVKPIRPGTIVISDPRYMVQTPSYSTLTVVPEGMTANSWLPSCAKISVFAPPPGARLSTPLVIQGYIEKLSANDLVVARIEAWTNDQKVSSIERVDFTRHDPRSEFSLTIPDLPSRTHSVLLVAYYQNNTIAATATMPLTILPDQATGSASNGYRGNIDLPASDSLLGLPVIVEGWVVVTGSINGTGVGSVEVWNGPRESGKFLTEAHYGTFRPDVAQSLGDPRFASSGFLAQLPDLPAGQVDLHIYVRDREKGEYVSPGFRQALLTHRFTLVEGKVTDAAWPVALAAAPDGRLFFAELLTGNIRILQDGLVLPNPFATLDDVSNAWESGLLGLTLHPDFPRQPYVYAMYVVEDPETGFSLMQRIVRFRDSDNVGEDYTVVVDDLPTTSSRHNGGRIGFGPDEKLYVSIGDVGTPDKAQDTMHYAGSILRFNPDGSIPSDNPYPGSAVYAIGLRNVFGFAFQPETGNLYATENGPGGFDEVNKIEAGKNYGWPGYKGVTNVEGIVDPIAVYGNWPQPSYAPTGVGFDPGRKDLLLFCAFANAGLHALKLSGPEYTSVEDEFTLSTNCILDVTYSSDGWLYYSTISAIYRARLDDLLRLQSKETQ